MIKNYMLSALRHFLRHKGFSFINIFGLAIGIAVSIVGFLYVMNELSYDKFHKNSGRIYRVAVDAMIGNTAIYQTYTSAPMANAFYEFFPQVEKVTRLRTFGARPFTYEEKTFIEENWFLVDSTFFDIFDFPAVLGQKENLLTTPFTAVITRSTARRYFGDDDPIGKVIQMDDDQFKVIAMVEDVPENSHFHFDILFGLISYPRLIESQGWFNNSYLTYLMLHPNADVANVRKRLSDYTDKYLFGGNYSRHTEKGDKWELYLQPLTSIHLNSDLRGELEPNGRKEYVYIFMLVSVFILVIACINFINLSTAKSTLRAREVGIRKTVGAGRNTLMRQYLVESLVTSFTALLLALVLVELILSYLKHFEGIHLEMPYFSNVLTIPLLLILAVAVGFLSGFYPSLVLSSFNPLRVLKNKPLTQGNSLHLRNGLVTFQFIISVFLIIGTFTVYRQLELLQEKDLGFDKEHVVTINHARVVTDRMEPIKNDLKSLPFVESASAVFRMPGSRFINLGFTSDDLDESFTLNLSGCDADFVEVVKPEIVQGRFFSREFGLDSAAIVVNQQAVELLGYDDPIGKVVKASTNPPLDLHIIGVVKDLCYESRHNKVHPMGFVSLDGNSMQPGVIALRLQPGDYSAMIPKIEKVWNAHAPGIAFDYSFFDDDYDRLYSNEMQTRKLFLAFAVLAVLVACLGLLGLASYLAQQKTREIAVRKTFGATSASVSVMLAANFTKWVLLANLIAWPLSWLFFDRWLDNFAYRTEILWWFFLAAAIISLLIALITVVYQTVKASLTNPAEALRYE